MKQEAPASKRSEGGSSSQRHPGLDDELMGTIQDITEWKKAETVIRQTEKLSAVGQLAAGVAHEIRNPLTALGGFAQLLDLTFAEAKDIQNVDKQQQYLAIMKSELSRIELIVNELLMLSKPQAVRFEPADLRTLLKDVVALLGAHAIMKSVLINAQYPAEFPLVECEPNQLKQVFINILKNAIEALPPWGTVEIQFACVGTDVMVQFTDEGEGIPDDLMVRLTEPFITTKENGNGLGLMVCKRIVGAHFGTMKIVSELGKGTEVSVRMPMIHEAPET